MRATEFIVEGEGKMHHHASNVSQGAHKMRDVGGYDRVYHMNRIMMAMAMADGKNKKPIKMDSSSWVEKYNTAHPYTEEEHNMMHQAMATIPTEHHEVVPFSKSREPNDIHKVSPVAGFRGYGR
jgi:seryl-tRNA synthetase